MHSCNQAISCCKSTKLIKIIRLPQPLNKYPRQRLFNSKACCMTTKSEVTCVDENNLRLQKAVSANNPNICMTRITSLLNGVWFTGLIINGYLPPANEVWGKVCHSVHRGVCLQGWSASRGVCLQGGLHPWGVCTGGFASRGVGQTPPPQNRILR